jgi:hypothetical protein
VEILSVPITCNESIEQNGKAIALIEEGAKNCSAARVALANTMKKMAQLELEMAIHVRKTDFIRLTLSVCKDLVFHILRTKTLAALHGLLKPLPSSASNRLAKQSSARTTS